MRPPRIDFYSTIDGRRLAARVWEGPQSPRVQLVFLHGISSHSGWYYRCGEYLANAGFAAHFLDRRGSGLNAEGRGDVDRWQTWVDDVALYVQNIRNSRPIVLCGISWGGKLAVATSRLHPGMIDGLALICPGIYSPHDSRVLQRIALGMPAPNGLMNRRVRIPLRRPALFTDSPKWREFIARDPLTLREVTWRFAGESQRLTSYARDSASYLHVPLLLLLAGRDRIVDKRRTVSFFHRTAAVTRRLIEYPNAAHTLEFESNPQPYFEDLADWGSRHATRHSEQSADHGHSERSEAERRIPHKSE